MSDLVYILNGPNLNLLGQREPHIYGATTLADIETMCADRAKALGLEIDFRQSSHEGTLVDWIHEAREKAKAILINAGAYTHTSVAILDALKSFEGPIVELHLSNVHRREEFRHKSFVSLAATGVIAGLGPQGYLAALDFVAED